MSLRQTVSVLVLTTLVATSAALAGGMRGLTEARIEADPAFQGGQVIPPPPWLQDAAQLALQLNGVYSSQGLRTGKETYHLALRGPRPCSEDAALWQEFEALVPFVNAIAGFCYTILVEPEGKVTGNGHLLAWKLTVTGIQPPQVLRKIAALARAHVPGAQDAEIWNDDAGSQLVIYRTAFCPDSNPNADLRSDFDGVLEGAGINASIFEGECYRNQAGPFYNPGPKPADRGYAHVQRVAKKEQ